MELLRVEGLTKHYYLRRHWWNQPESIEAVGNVSFTIQAGESMGLVGESGCGKSTLAQLITLLEPPTAGRIYFRGREITGLDFQAQRNLRPKLQIVFQEAASALNPRFTVLDTLREPLANYELVGPSETKQRIRETAEAVEVPERLFSRFPHELSGGERQRVCIARALMLKPEFIVLDEVTTGLDVTLQYRILQLLRRLGREMGLTYLFITHDLRLVTTLTATVAVMKDGQIVESVANQLLGKAKHPYTRTLLNSVPVRHPRLRRDWAASESVML